MSQSKAGTIKGRLPPRVQVLSVVVWRCLDLCLADNGCPAGARRGCRGSLLHVASWRREDNAVTRRPLGAPGRLQPLLELPALLPEASQAGLKLTRLFLGSLRPPLPTPHVMSKVLGRPQLPFQLLDLALCRQSPLPPRLQHSFVHVDLGACLNAKWYS
eukprot:scaffold53827_cov46-Prasinocladus_malaysianus.AAC.5